MHCMLQEVAGQAMLHVSTWRKHSGLTALLTCCSVNAYLHTGGHVYIGKSLSIKPMCLQALQNMFLLHSIRKHQALAP